MWQLQTRDNQLNFASSSMPLIEGQRNIEYSGQYESFIGKEL